MMPAIVLNYEQSHKQTRGWHGQQQRNPVRPEDAQVHQIPESAERQQRVGDLPAALELVGTLESRQATLPGTTVTRVRGTGFVRAFSAQMASGDSSVNRSFQFTGQVK